jgi:uncharacterized membrane protein
MMLIHFPAALLPMDFVCYAISFYTGENSFLKASFYAMAGAVILGWLATIFGALDLLKIPREKTDVMKKALLHGGINTTVIIGFTIFASIAFKKYPLLPAASFIVLVVKAALVAFMFFGNYLGGSLVLKDRIGAEETI